MFVLPARFSVPVLCGAPEDLAGLDNLDALADYLLQLPARPAWDYTSAGYYEPLEQPYGLGFVSVEQLLDFVLGSSAAAPLTEDGGERGGSGSRAEICAAGGPLLRHGGL